jgi:hypothetical protein
MAQQGKSMGDDTPPKGPTISVLPGKILDLRPLLKRKIEDSCQHHYATVSMTAAELSCDNCGADLDPWTFIRNLCEHDELMTSWRQEQESAVDAKIEEGNKIIARMNDTITRLNAEISHLTDVKNKLWNEHTPDGRLLVDAARRHRPRKK